MPEEPFSAFLRSLIFDAVLKVSNYFLLVTWRKKLEVLNNFVLGT
jgi:hypothetical protein